MSEEIAVYQPTGEVSPYTNPQQEVERAHKMAKVLQDVVRQAKLSKSFTKGGKEHLFFEAWQTRPSAASSTVRLKSSGAVLSCTMTRLWDGRPALWCVIPLAV